MCWDMLSRKLRLTFLTLGNTVNLAVGSQFAPKKRRPVVPPLDTPAAPAITAPLATVAGAPPTPPPSAAPPGAAVVPDAGLSGASRALPDPPACAPPLLASAPPAAGAQLAFERSLQDDSPSLAAPPTSSIPVGSAFAPRDPSSFSAASGPPTAKATGAVVVASVARGAAGSSAAVPPLPASLVVKKTAALPSHLAATIKVPRAPPQYRVETDEEEAGEAGPVASSSKARPKPAAPGKGKGKAAAVPSRAADPPTEGNDVLGAGEAVEGEDDDAGAGPSGVKKPRAPPKPRKNTAPKVKLPLAEGAVAPVKVKRPRKNSSRRD